MMNIYSVNTMIYRNTNSLKGRFGLVKTLISRNKVNNIYPRKLI